MKRRSFLRAALTFLGVTTAASFAYPLFRFLVPAAPEKNVHSLLIAKRDVPLGDAKEIVFGGIPAVIVNRPGKGLIALSRVCTHLGCLVQYDQENKILLCPCHAGVYDLEGNIVSGPPPKPLTKLPLKVEGETIVIG